MAKKIFSLLCHYAYMYLSWLSLQYLSLFHLASMTNPPDAYFYSDTYDLVWDKRFNCWIKDGTSHLSPSPSPSPSPDHHSTPTLHSYSSATSVLDVEGSASTLCMATPEPSQYHGGGGKPITTGSGGGCGCGGGGHARPLSQMSFSDDLQTIPSQEVLFTCTCTISYYYRMHANYMYLSRYVHIPGSFIW